MSMSKPGSLDYKGISYGAEKGEVIYLDYYLVDTGDAGRGCLFRSLAAGDVDLSTFHL